MSLVIQLKDKLTHMSRVRGRLTHYQFHIFYQPNSVAKVDSTAQMTKVCSLYPMMLHSNTGQQ